MERNRRNCLMAAWAFSSSHVHVFVTFKTVKKFQSSKKGTFSTTKPTGQQVASQVAVPGGGGRQSRAAEDGCNACSACQSCLICVDLLLMQASSSVHTDAYCSFELQLSNMFESQSLHPKKTSSLFTPACTASDACMQM
jgi:hypothetical protein